MNSASVSKLLDEMMDFSVESWSKNFDYLSIAVSKKWMELGYKHLNRHEGCAFSCQHAHYIVRYLNQLYGIQIKMPKEC